MFFGFLFESEVFRKEGHGEECFVVMVLKWSWRS